MILLFLHDLSYCNIHLYPVRNRCIAGSSTSATFFFLAMFFFVIFLLKILMKNIRITKLYINKLRHFHSFYDLGAHYELTWQHLL